jgi:hypothetical protein
MTKNTKNKDDKSLYEDYNQEEFDDSLYDTVTPLINEMIKNNSKKGSRVHTDYTYLQTQSHMYVN